MNETRSIDIVLSLIADGMFSVDAEGSVWRHKIRTRWGYRAVPERRADHVFPVGYRYVSVTINRKQVAVPAHRVVWQALHGAIPDGMQINHKDGDRSNNRPDNLEVVTGAENIQHSYDKLGRSRIRPLKFDNATREMVVRLKSAGMSYRRIEKETGVSAAASRQIFIKHSACQ